MTGPTETFRALLNAGVPDSVGRILSLRGHLVVRHRDVLPERTTDDEVYETAIRLDAVLLVIDRDASRAVRRYDAKLRQDRLKTLCVILLACPEPTAHLRLEQAMSLIQLEWGYCREKPSRRLWIDIGTHYIRTNR
ncbi:MAG: hypothetical protein IT534_02220 [Bauldia sp.]|nr:hypothetical protein [Bauldia sp.]